MRRGSGPALPGFIEHMPKAELHLHLDGVPKGRAGRVSALRTEPDFYGLAMAYFRTAASQRVRYAEVFFDPQAHTGRGVPFEAVIGGFHRARDNALAEFGLRAQLIMCFMRDLPAEDAMRTLEQSLPHRDKIVGVGLDSDERENPPIKFKDVFERARGEGYRVTIHCEVGQADSVDHIWQCLDDIGAERIDHGINCVEDAALVARMHDDLIGLTICPMANRRAAGGLRADDLKLLLDYPLKVTVNSGDPAYFGGYLTENLTAVARAVRLTQNEVVRLTRNAFEIAWLPVADRDRYLAELSAYATQNSLSPRRTSKPSPPAVPAVRFRSRPSCPTAPPSVAGRPDHPKCPIISNWRSINRGLADDRP
jgi:adenosine deaminase